ncbi:MAG: Trp family transcriptional regulator [Candidatus Zixiibacteriota bacterium]
MLQATNEIYRVFSEIDDFPTMKKFFEEIFTPAEIQDVALRWRLMKLLYDRVPQRQIAAELGISLCKITRGSKILKKRQSITKKILESHTGGQHATPKPTPTRSRP